MMRHIYVDEAGTSDTESVTVVVGVVVRWPAQYEEVEAEIARLILTVPMELRGGFVSHATAIRNGRKYGDIWSRAERDQFLKAMLAIPRRLKLPISIAFIRRDNPVEATRRVTRVDMQHGLAFAWCIAGADQYLRRFCRVRDVAKVVAEDVKERRSVLTSAAREYQERPVRMPTASALDVSTNDFEAFEAKETAFEYRVSRIVHPIQFVPKTGRPILQIADACAFATRRYLSKYQDGQELVHAMLGHRSLSFQEEIDLTKSYHGSLLHIPFDEAIINSYRIAFPSDAMIVVPPPPI